jgi:hypothetical protein
MTLPVLSFVMLALAVQAGAGGTTRVFPLEDFETYPKGAIPVADWYSRNGDPKKEYRIAEDPAHTRYLEARDLGFSVQFFKEIKWKLKEYPKIRWRWRVRKFPAGSDERNGATNDSAAALYVVFPRRFFLPETIKYVWSEKVPVGTAIIRRKNFPILVVRSGAAEQGKWVEEMRDVAADYRRLFKREAPDPVGIGFLTDANETKSSAEADYDDVAAVMVPADRSGTPGPSPTPRDP